MFLLPEPKDIERTVVGTYVNPLFPGSKASARRKAYAKALKNLQDALGRQNDFIVHEKLADQIVRKKDASQSKGRETFAMGYIPHRARGSRPLHKSDGESRRQARAAETILAEVACSITGRKSCWQKNDAITGSAPGAACNSANKDPGSAAVDRQTDTLRRQATAHL